MAAEPIAVKKELAPGPANHLAILLAAVAGFMDVLTVLTLYRLFATMLTGNIVFFSISLVLQTADNTRWLHGMVIPVFLLGTVAGTALTEVLALRRVNAWHITTAMLIMETLTLLVAFAGGRAWVEPVPLPPDSWQIVTVGSLIALAMGLHMIVLEKVGDVPVITSFATVTLVGIARIATQWLVDRVYPDREASAHPAAIRAADRAFIRVRSRVLGGFIGGILAGSWATHWLGFSALLLPIAGLTGGIFWLLRRGRAESGSD